MDSRMCLLIFEGGGVSRIPNKTLVLIREANREMFWLLLLTLMITDTQYFVHWVCISPTTTYSVSPDLKHGRCNKDQAFYSVPANGHPNSKMVIERSSNWRSPNWISNSHNKKIMGCWIPFRCTHSAISNHFITVNVLISPWLFQPICQIWK